MKLTFDKTIFDYTRWMGFGQTSICGLSLESGLTPTFSNARRENIPNSKGIQNVIPRKLSVITAASSNEIYIEVNARVSAPSTTPIPAGVGDTITNNELILKQAMIVPIDMGILKARKTRVRMIICEVLLVNARNNGRSILLG
jgi:hypothetical protein